MNSLEKLADLVAGTSDIVPEDEEQARLVQMLQLAGPFIGELIPDTPEDLDALLLGLLGWTVQLRSDDADPAPAIRALGEAHQLICRRAGIGASYTEPQPPLEARGPADAQA